MGLGHSKPESESNGPADTTFFAPKQGTTVNFSETLLNQLSGESGPPPVRSDKLDKHIQDKIHAEIARLQKQEADVRAQIAKALEKENVERERAEAKDGSRPLHSAVLHTDLAELEKRTLALKESLLRNKDEKLWQAVQGKEQTLTECLVANKTKPFKCKDYVDEFKAAVGSLESSFVSSIH